MCLEEEEPRWAPCASARPRPRRRRRRTQRLRPLPHACACSSSCPWITSENVDEASCEHVVCPCGVSVKILNKSLSGVSMKAANAAPRRPFLSAASPPALWCGFYILNATFLNERTRRRVRREHIPHARLVVQPSAWTLLAWTPSHPLPVFIVSERGPWLAGWSHGLRPCSPRPSGCLYS